MNFLFETPRLMARNFTIDDAAILNELHRDEIVVSTTSGNPQSIEETKNEIEIIIKNNLDHGATQLAFFDKAGNFVGRCGLIYRSFASEDDFSYEIRYAIHRAFQSQGYGIEMVKSYLDFLFSNNQKITKVIAGVRLDGHAASTKILTKLGFRYTENKIFLGNKKETKMYEISIDEWKN